MEVLDLLPPDAALEERYGSFEAYRKRFSDKCADMVRDRYLLQEDADRAITGLESVRTRFAK